MPDVRSELRPMWQLAWPLVAAELGWMLQGTADLIMAGPLGAAAIGARVVDIWFGDDRARSPSAARITVSSVAVPVFTWIGAQEGPFTPEKLRRAHPAFPPGEIGNLLKVCVQAQLVKPLWFPML